MQFNYTDWKVVLWGHKTTENTFYYIHQAYVKAFKHLGAQAYWFDDNDNVNDSFHTNTLYLTEGQVDKKIPISHNCLYVIHNCYDPKYLPLIADNKAVRMQTYTDDALKYNTTKMDDCVLADYDGKCIYFPWATDLLPHEIEANKSNRVFNSESKLIRWVGTVGEGSFGNLDQITPFQQACQANGIRFEHGMNVVPEEHIKFIQNSYMAPTIVGKWQHEKGYVPCRIFKNISYGQMGITNSPRIHELFQQKVIHNNDTRLLFYNARTYMESMPLTELHALMDVVKNKHTYINRIGAILDFLEKTCQ